MYIAMNRFRVVKGGERDFERMWAERDTHLREVPGFMEFHLLRGAEAEDHTLYASHTLWQSQADFEAWTKSDAFRKAHAGAAKSSANSPSLYLDRPQFEGFEAIQAVTKD
ncbi:MAG: antibiotic biosynthesis monooxygenase [Rhodospirillaceae bacterium]|jgi:heme-degrading monooxygenase HmoA|nr:antibiotic biosynthesis monooxygenase [Rhodospirillaceae bacterium]MBT5191664.1 antibiotic biosynthesis monooxygenase [Rhodospirillaceae bacterium]MBT5895014.1 antibiotic biosynthesis monooxygenase [Rhodospirillaceae bacterium]MBT6430591.1 antibiotic biosynthesis monooxygenase [Rhodospirillaceae bacterium]MBT7760847.1 antibiotic biosynthesis monooxygenase [Rhodospirillaceae bacterium]